jgi:hypothetical protein
VRNRFIRYVLRGDGVLQEHSLHLGNDDRGRGAGDIYAGRNPVDVGTPEISRVSRASRACGVQIAEPPLKLNCCAIDSRSSPQLFTVNIACR